MPTPEALIPVILFYSFAAVLIGSALMVITAKHPVHSVLFLILAFFNSAGLFVMLGAEFIAMLMVIVYVGAVAVLFLFVVMMLDVDFSALRAGFVKTLPIGLLVSIVILAQLVMVINVSLHGDFSIASPTSPLPVTDTTNTKALGLLLYTDYIYPFQISGLILLIAMVGAITLTLRTRDGVRKQNVNKQIDRNAKNGVEIVKVSSGKGI